MTAEPVLSVDQLCVDFQTRRGVVRAVRGVSLTVQAGETLCIVGESGSGKSTMALALPGLLPRNARSSGRVRLLGNDLLGAPERDLENVRGKRIGVVFQDAARALNPVLTIGRQIVDVMLRHLGVPEHVALTRAVELLGEVGVSDPKTRMRQYPHQLSGGLKQRVMIAVAIACEPELVIADEPTTALDVSVQGQVLRLLRRLCTERRIALLLITHNFGVVSALADRVAVMYAGRIVESAGVVTVLREPAHPYTRALLGASPRLELGDGIDAPALAPIPGTPPSPLSDDAGCSYAPRCTFRFDKCIQRPPLREFAAGGVAACWL